MECSELESKQRFLSSHLTLSFSKKNRKKNFAALVAPLLGNGIQLDDSRRLVLAGGCAVVAVNLVMLLYVLSAFAEGGSGSGSGGGGSGSGEEKKKSK